MSSSVEHEKFYNLWANFQEHLMQRFTFSKCLMRFCMNYEVIFFIFVNFDLDRVSFIIDLFMNCYDCMIFFHIKRT